MVARQAETTLFERVGGRDGIHTVVADTVQRHLVNDQIKHLMDGVDADHLVMQVTDFLVIGTGGEGEYQSLAASLAQGRDYELSLARSATHMGVVSRSTGHARKRTAGVRGLE